MKDQCRKTNSTLIFSLLRRKRAVLIISNITEKGATEYTISIKNENKICKISIIAEKKSERYHPSTI